MATNQAGILFYSSITLLMWDDCFDDRVAWNTTMLSFLSLPSQDSVQLNRREEVIGNIDD